MANPPVLSIQPGAVRHIATASLQPISDQLQALVRQVDGLKLTAAQVGTFAHRELVDAAHNTFVDTFTAGLNQASAAIVDMTDVSTDLANDMQNNDHKAQAAIKATGNVAT